MCGIVGMAGKIELDHRNAFKTLLHLDALRGTDSTGMACIEKGKDPQVDVLKVASHPYDLMDHVRFDKILVRPNRVILGHNRYATHGKVITRNAHPFHIGKIVGVHNGVISNKHVFKDGYTFDVDSLALFNHIDKVGLKDAIDKASGGWSLVWWDTEENTLNFLRNAERPMFIGLIGTETIMWASEEWMLQVAAARNKLKFDEIQKTEENMHIKLPIDQDGKFGESIEEEVKSSPVPFQRSASHSVGSNWNQRVNQSLTQGTQTTKEAGSSVAELRRFPTLPYAGKTGRLLRATTLVNAVGGARYLICNDLEMNVLGTVRLYVNQKDEPNAMMGKVFRADIHQNADYEQHGGLIYKVIYSSVDFNWNRKKEEEQKEEEEETRYVGPRGQLYAPEVWNKNYSKCSMCDSDIEYAEGSHRFLNNGEVLCGSCCNDGQILQYLPAFETRH